MTLNELTLKAAELGFLPQGPAPESDVNKTLAEVARSQDQGFWEAFPVLLVNAVESGEFSYAAANAHLEEAERKFLKLLIMISLGLYESLGVKYAWRESLFGGLPARLIGSFRDRIRSGSGLELGRLRLLPEKLKANFARAFKKAGTARREAEAGEKLDLELAVLQILHSETERAVP